MQEFDKWWNDLKKHKKRVDHWLPHWRRQAETTGRKIKYLTLCARTMIDVFLLAREGLVEVDPETNAIAQVSFCERERDPYLEILDILGTEGVGFYGGLEDLVLFEDDPLTDPYPDQESIERALSDEGIDARTGERLRQKRTSTLLRESFPYDAINLDFCDYYYPADPPNMMKINDTVKKIISWQRGGDGSPAVPSFLLAVTCRHDAAFPDGAEAHLRELIKKNQRTSKRYAERLRETRGLGDPPEWDRMDPEDTFLSGWPKDIAESAAAEGWSVAILENVRYERVGESGTRYTIACLVLRLTSQPNPDPMTAAVEALDAQKRRLIPDIDPDSAEGKRLARDLDAIADARDDRAVRVGKSPIRASAASP